VYALRFPLRPLQTVTGLDSPIVHSRGSASLEFRYVAPQLIITVRGLATAEEGRAFARRLWSASKWALVAHDLDSQVELDLDEPTYAKDSDQAAPNPVVESGGEASPPRQGIASGHQPVVFPESINLRFLTMGEARLIGTTPASMIVDALVEGLALPCGAELPEDQRLRLALDLLSAYHRETTVSSKLVTLCMVLEVLSETTTQPYVAIEYLERWDNEVSERLYSMDSASEDFFALDSLRREILRRRETSKRGRVRRLILETLGADQVDLARRAVRAYDSRSTLVHEGSIPAQELDTAETDARDVVVQILRAKLTA